MSAYKLGDIVIIKKGRKAEDTSDVYLDGSKRFIQIDDLRNDNKIKYTKSEGVFATENDVLIAWDGANAGTVGYGLSGVIGSTIACLEIDKDRFSGAFIGKCLQSKFHKIRQNCTGATIPHIRRDYLLNIKVPNIDKQKQKQIVQTLDTADTLRQKRKEQLNLLDDYLKSVFFEMFGDPVRNKKCWNSCKVIDICDCIVPGRDKPKSFTGSMPWVTTDDLECLGWTLNSKKNVGLTSEEITTVRAKVIPKDSVIMTCVGDLGVVSIAKNEFVMNQQLHAFICSKRIKNIFLMFSLFFQKDYMLRMASSTTVPYMNKAICNSVPVLLPPIKLQNKFASIVEQVEQTKQKMRASLNEMDNHFNALMQRYFG